MKRFIITNLLAAVSVSMMACAIPGTHNYYLFSTVEQTGWESSVQQSTMDNWRAYAGQKDLSWFDADEMISVARKKGDALMVSYIEQLKKYLDVAGKVSETWEYPTKKQLMQRQQTLQNVRKYAFSKIKTRLRSQHALLYMRCNMLLGHHQTNVQFWEQTAQKYINSVYRDMMRNIYAGALLKAGRSEEATQIFMEQGDMASLYTYYYKKRSLAAIRAEYQKNANAAALPFLLQDFANNAQEAIDAQNEEYNIPGKLFVRDIKQKEAQGMYTLVEQVIREKKTKDPALWKSLEAWLQYLFGDKQAALKNIREAAGMDGRPRVKDNARVLRLFIESAMAKPCEQHDNFLSSELAWLFGKAKEEGGDDYFYGNHYTRAYDRLVHQVLKPVYEAAGRTEQAVAFLAVIDEQERRHEREARKRIGGEESHWNSDYSTHFFWCIDSMPVEKLVAYKAFVDQSPESGLDRWLLENVSHDDEFLNEVIGTKYLRLARWTEAACYLSEVSIDFVNRMNIVPFMARRDYRIEPWRKRQRIKIEDQEPGNIKVSHNQKLEFAREMANLEQGFGAMSQEERASRAYQLAVRYAQASYAGDAWYLTHYGKSVADTAVAGELDMLKKASELLAITAQMSDFDWEERSLYAQAWLPFDPWYKEEWSDAKSDFVKLLRPESRQYKALQALQLLEQRNPARISYYVSHCDVLSQFAKSQGQSVK